MQAFKRVADLTCIVEKGEGLKGLSNLILLNGFRILAIKFFQVVLKRAKCDSNGEKWLFFYEKLQKNCLANGSEPPTVIRLSYSNLLSTMTR